MAGRPPKPAGEARSGNTLRIRLTNDERSALDQAADIVMGDAKTPGSGRTSTWAREILLKAAKRALKSQ